MGKKLDVSEGVKYFDFFIFCSKMFKTRSPLAGILQKGYI
jgi:hypothetical protein